MADKTNGPKPIDPFKPKPAPKKRRSSGLQTMARIERILDDLAIIDYNRVLTWLKSLPAKDTAKEGAP